MGDKKVAGAAHPTSMSETLHECWAWCRSTCPAYQQFKELGEEISEQDLEGFAMQEGSDGEEGAEEPLSDDSMMGEGVEKEVAAELDVGGLEAMSVTNRVEEEEEEAKEMQEVAGDVGMGDAEAEALAEETGIDEVCHAARACITDPPGPHGPQTTQTPRTPGPYRPMDPVRTPRNPRSSLTQETPRTP